MSISTTTRQSTFAEVCTEMDRRGEVIERLEAALRAAEAERERMRDALVDAQAEVTRFHKILRVNGHDGEAAALAPTILKIRAALQSTSAKEGEL